MASFSLWRLTNPVNALKQLTQLFNEEWDGVLWLQDLYDYQPVLGKNQPLYEPLLRVLPAGKTVVIEVGQKKFVVQHHPPGMIAERVEFIEAGSI